MFIPLNPCFRSRSAWPIRSQLRIRIRNSMLYADASMKCWRCWWWCCRWGCSEPQTMSLVCLRASLWNASPRQTNSASLGDIRAERRNGTSALAPPANRRINVSASHRRLSGSRKHCLAAEGTWLTEQRFVYAWMIIMYLWMHWEPLITRLYYERRKDMDSCACTCMMHVG